MFVISGDFRYVFNYTNNTLKHVFIYYNNILYMEVRKSNIDGAGLGLFACRNFRVGFSLGEYPGKFVNHITCSNREYALQVGKDSYIDGSCVANRLHNNEILESDMKLGYLLCFANHRDTSNIYPTGKTRGGHYFKSSFVVVQDIKVGDELVWKYYYE